MRVAVLCLVTLISLWAAPMALAEEQPRRGGILQVALAGDPPSLDVHQEQTFMVAQPMGPVCNNLIHFDPHKYPEIIGDLAKSWTVSDDHLTYTFTLHEGVKFHDGSELTSADVKASWDRIVFPTDGVISPRRSIIRWSKVSKPPIALQWSSACNTLAVVSVEHGSPGQFHLCQKISRFGRPVL